MVTTEEVSSHSTAESCWVIIRDQAYDVTHFLNEHPGGVNSILAYAGKDATEEYEAEHPEGTIQKHLDKKYHLGTVTGDFAVLQPPLKSTITPATSPSRPSINHIQNLDELERVTKETASENAWAYYSTSADTTTTFQNNRSDWSKVSFRPRVLRDVAKVDTRQKVMGHDSALPIFAAPAARAKLGNPDGELCIVRGTSRSNVPYCTSNSASTTHSVMADCFKTEQKNGSKGALFWQLYVPVDKSKARDLVREAKELGFKALVITVDSAVIGKREADALLKAQVDNKLDVLPDMNNDAFVPRGHHTSTLDWNDLKWIREEWAATGPVVLKGIQTAEDALLAMEAGVDGIYLSNHGGRQLDHAPSSLKTLLEIRKFYPQVLERLEVYLDGGCRRGTDVVKALCLGATAVGFGRPFLYALTGYGTAGVERVVRILTDEIQTTMRLLGVTKLDQLNPNYVNIKLLENELTDRIDWPMLKSRL
ncbi:hypothetical protein PRZ48_005502 [Zasmidium cellare]|uniref:Uncharacterized protein n=1 Tax=Zasmidium cellare TaxID=395010 RepID=A0ABR0ESJ7_ZASCE|nr:hypothetical protein PRZ48_005502 [Zasmidium cellare]